MVYNLHIFEKAVFKVPSTKRLTLAVLLLSATVGGMISVVMPELVSYQMGLVMPLIFLGLGEIIYRMTPEFPRNWSYLTSLFNLSILALFSTPLIITSSFFSTEVFASILLILLTLNFGIFIVAAGNNSIVRVMNLSYIMPLTVLGIFYASNVSSLNPFGVYLGLFGVILLGVYYAHEYLFSSNISSFTGANLVSGLIQGRRENLDLGHRVNTKNYTLGIENEEKTCIVGAPWIHPGPLRHFGASTISRQTIDNFDTGFFFHLPSTHWNDPVETSSIEKIMEAYKMPDMDSRASKLIKKQFDSFELYGRNLGDKRIVFMKSSKFDDYQKQIISEVIDEQRDLVVDLHPHKEHQNFGTMFQDSQEAEKLRERLQDFLSEIDDLELSSYRAGFENGECGKQFFSLVEEVEGQKTLVLGCDENGVGESIRKFADDKKDRYDYVLALSTDTHEDIIDMTLGKNMDKKEMQKTWEKAEQNLSDARIGIATTDLNDVKVLGTDYLTIMSTVNIVVRMFALTIFTIVLSIALFGFI